MNEWRIWDKEEATRLSRLLGLFVRPHKPDKWHWPLVSCPHSQRGLMLFLGREREQRRGRESVATRDLRVPVTQEVLIGICKF